MSEQERIPPHALEAEMSVLGAVLVDRSTFEIAAEALTGSDFYAPRNEQLWNAMAHLYASAEPIDKIALADELRKRNALDKIGGLPYLSQLMETVPTASSAEFYASIVREKSVFRGLISAGRRIETIGYEAEDDVPDALLLAEQTLGAVSARGLVRAPRRTTDDLSKAIFRRVDERVMGLVKPPLLTPWGWLNESTGGFNPGESVLLAADAKTGKSAALVCLADYISANFGAVAIFTNEMPEEEIHRRHVALYSRIPARRILLGKIDDHEWGQLSEALEITGGRPIFYFGFGTSSMADIRREANRLKAERPDLCAIMIDHCGNISDVDKDDGRTRKDERLSRVYKAMPRLAAETETSVFGVQHINRAGAKGRPTKHDVRDGGNPEGHFNTIILLYRPNPDGKAEEREVGEFIIAASREGVQGTIPMRYLGARSLWLEERDQTPWFEAAQEPKRQTMLEGVA